MTNPKTLAELIAQWKTLEADFAEHGANEIAHTILRCRTELEALADSGTFTSDRKDEPHATVEAEPEIIIHDLNRAERVFGAEPVRLPCGNCGHGMFPHDGERVSGVKDWSCREPECDCKEWVKPANEESE